jgi:hypothetical protein
MPAPADYEAWYHTPRGAWIAQREFDLLWRLLPMPPGATLLAAAATSPAATPPWGCTPPASTPDLPKKISPRPLD